MSDQPATTISHIGLHCFDRDNMVDFYTRVIGLVETDRGGPEDLVFLSGDPERDHHQMGLAPGRAVGQDAGPFLNQISFRVDSLDTLKARADAVAKEGITDVRQQSHGNAWSIYFPDPEGNTIEVFADTPFYVRQPCRDDLDLSKSNDEILAETKALHGNDPEFEPFDDWKSKMAGKTPVGA